MSSSRNKRKRTDADLPPVCATETTIPSTRRTSVALGDEPVSVAHPKNGGEWDGSSYPVAETPTNIATAHNDNDDDSSSSSNNNNSSSSSSSSSSNGEPNTASEAQQQEQHVEESTKEPLHLQITNADPKAAPEDGNPSAMDQTVNASAIPHVYDPTAQGILPHSNDGSNGQDPQRKPQPQLDYISNRQSQLKSMLAHRKLLLDQTRSSRSAVRRRMYVLAMSDPRSVKVASVAAGVPLSTVSWNSALTGSTATITKPVETTKDESEIAAFKKLGRMALQAARKQKGDGTEASSSSSAAAQPTASSVSLRRGAIVGKKLNSVLSSLVPASSIAVDGNTPAQPPQIPIKSQLAALHSADYKTPIPTYAKNMMISPTPANSVILDPAQQHDSLLKPDTHASRSLKHPVAHQPQMIDSLSKGARNATQRTAARNIEISKMPYAAIASATATPGRPHPLDFKAGLPTNNSNNKLEPLPVVFQQASALRDRKKTLLTQLEKMKKRKPGSLQAPARGNSSFGRTDGRKTSFKCLSSAATNDLPRRRRTHWDNLLEEMKWLATDYIEERKWKTAAARTLSGSATERGANSVKPASERHTGDTVVASQILKINGDSSQPTPKINSSLSPLIPIEAITFKDVTFPANGLFTTPTNDDKTHCKATAKSIAKKVQDYGCVSMGAGSVMKSRPYGTASGSRVSQSSHRASEGPGATQDGNTGNGVTLSTAAENSDSKSSSFTRISLAIQSLLEKINRLDGKAKRMHKEDGNKVSLMQEQQDMIDFIEDKWSYGASAVIKGCRASGKTVSVCLLLGRRQDHGPHVVVCSNLRVIKWMHELKRHTNLKILKSVAAGEFSRGEEDVESFNSNDILVCEYSVFEKLKKQDIQHFRTVVVDSRHPRGFLGSRLPALSDTSPLFKQHFPRAIIPSELLSKPFWEKLVESAAKAPFNCLLIENLGEAIPLLETINMTEVQSAELTALRTALVLGAHIFSSPTSSVLKRILTWGRRKARENIETTTNIINLVQEKLHGMTKSFCFDSKESLLEQILWQGQGPIESEVRLCKLSPGERREYEKCCLALRGALSSDVVRCNEGFDVRRKTLHTTAQALVRVRKQCSHSTLSTLFRKKSMQTRVRLCVGDGLDNSNLSIPELQDGQSICRNLEDNPSQTDLELAAQILLGSAKLRELLSVLRNECNCKVEGLAEFVASSQPNAMAHSSFPTKVVILATLPEVQILVSVLLHCVGIGHEFVKSPWMFSRQSCSALNVDVLGKSNAGVYLAWLECQEALSRFNSPPSLGGVAGRSILIASSEVVGCDIGGIGVDMADFIISIDDDWSGRNELVVRSLVAGLCRRKQVLKENCRFLTLVCEATCEATFLNVDSNKTHDSAQSEEPESWPWIIDARGRFTASKPTQSKPGWDLNIPLRNHREGIFAFPAQNVFRYRNQRLAKILSVEALPSCLDEGSSNMFLPCVGAEDTSCVGMAEADFVVTLMVAEEAASSAFCACRAMPPRQVSQYPLTPPEEFSVESNTIDLDTPSLRRNDSLSRMAVAQGRLAIQTDHGNPTEPDGKSSPIGRRAHGDDARPVHSAGCLLYYKQSKALFDQCQVKPGVIDPLTVAFVSSVSAEQLLLHVPNKFASAFSESQNSIGEDGKEGIESLVYLPPLAPGCLHHSVEAHHVSPYVMDHDLDIGWLPNETKRPGDGTESREAKRLKGDPSSVSRFDDTHPSASNAYDAVIANSTTPTLGPEAPIIPHNDFMSMDLDEDFESVDAPVGIANVPNYASLMLTASVDVFNRSLDTDQVVFRWARPEGPSPCDAEELEDWRTSPESISLDSVVLVVAAKQRPHSTPQPTSISSYRPDSNKFETSRGSRGSHAFASNAIYGSSSAYLEVNGTLDAAARMTKVALGTPTDTGLLAKAPLDIAQHPGSMAQPPLRYQVAGGAKANDSQKSQIVAFLSIRQKAMGRRMFESSQYRLAAARFKNRIEDRMLRQSSSLDVSRKRDDAIHSRCAIDEASFLDDPPPSAQRCVIGDETEGVVARQLNSCQSLQAPYCVDFGPFNGGFLQSSSGITGSWPPMPKNGVSLPMGVKVHDSEHLQQQPRRQPRPWMQDEDRRLKLCVKRFGLNWTLASYSFRDFDDRVDVDGNIEFRRTARECLHRWQKLSLHDHASEVQGVKAGVSNDLGLSSTSPDTAGRSRLLFSVTPQEGRFVYTHDASEPSIDTIDAYEPPINTSTRDTAADQSATPESTAEKLQKRGFASVLSADSKREVVSVTIPGSSPGSQPTFVASHPSHLDAVHSSIAASWTSGRTEMWPLQFLDVAEKQRAVRAANASCAVAHSSSQVASPIGSSASTPPEGSTRVPPPTAVARAATPLHHPIAPPNGAAYGHPHPQSLSQPFSNAHYPPHPPRQAGSYPPQMAPPPQGAARSPHHRMEPPQTMMNNVPRSTAPPPHAPRPPPKAAVISSSNHLEQLSVQKELAPTTTTPKQGVGGTTGSDNA